MALRDFSRTMMLPMRVWDAPTRLFHWAIALLVVVLSVTSVRANWMHLHLISGYLVLTLLLFRLVWGFVGSETSRFRQFLASPVKALQSLRTFRDRTPDTQVGHNPAGGWMVVVLLALLGVQVLSGLFNTEEYGAANAVAGPLMKYVSKQVSGIAGAIHAANFDLLLLAILVHISAIGAYARLKDHNLVRPMITGVKRLPAATRQPRLVSPLRAVAVLAVAGAAVWVLATWV
jgi:cytochrome b